MGMSGFDLVAAVIAIATIGVFAYLFVAEGHNLPGGFRS